MQRTTSVLTLLDIGAFASETLNKTILRSLAVRHSLWATSRGIARKLVELEMI